MPPAGFEPAIPVSERPQTHALDRTTNGIGNESSGSPKIRGISWITEELNTVHTVYVFIYNDMYR
jgi:hypothetical protein